MEIIIKSFNRAYCLERCLASIYKNIENYVKITIVDDGTPPKYLEKIKDLYPHVHISLTEEYGCKVKANSAYIENNIPIKKSIIPAKDWINAVNKLEGSYFLMMEDDCWLTEKIHPEVYAQQMKEYNIEALKLFWLGNEELVKGEKKNIHQDIELIESSLLTNKYLRIYYKFLFANRFRMNYIFKKVKLISINYYLPVYTLYTIVGVIFSKDYWLYVWESASSKIFNEFEQLTRALKWVNDHPHSKFAKLKKEKAQTSFLSSSRNEFNEKTHFNATAFNHIMNEAWYNGKLDVMESYPNDIKKKHVINIIKEAQDKRLDYKEWLNWSEAFQNAYRIIGCNV